jgi:renalase
VSILVHGVEVWHPSGRLSLRSRATAPLWLARDKLADMRIVVVGAGLSGLIAAGELAAAGHDVCLFDKGKGPGGRLATRRIAEATLDHGAQFFTVRSPRFAELVAGWTAAGLVDEWCRGFTEQDGFPRFAIVGGMNQLAKHLARDLDVRCSSLVFSIRPAGESGWTVGLDDASTHAADAVIVTTPVPQAYSLLVTSGISLPEAITVIDYERTLGLLAVLDGPSAVPPPGGVQRSDSVFSFIGDNQAKGISGIPAVTFHAQSEWSAAHWDADPHDVHLQLLDAARPWIGASRIVESQVKRWRFATPLTLWPDPCWLATPETGACAPLVLAGDAFGSARIEGAALSGLAAAEAILR